MSEDDCVQTRVRAFMEGQEGDGVGSYAGNVQFWFCGAEIELLLLLST
jgi:hypothetical protein